MVALPPSTALVLRDHCEHVDSQRGLLGQPPLAGSDLIFSRVDGSPMLPDSVSAAWRKLARRTGFHGIRLQDARHSHATLLLCYSNRAVHPKIVQERLGHATIATTLDTYSHVLSGLQEAAALSFDAIAQGSKSPSTTEVPATVG